MTFDLVTILVFSVAALIYAGLLPARWRGWALLIGSVVAIYWLQPPLPIRFLDYILPTATLVLVVVVWLFVRRPIDDESPAAFQREDAVAMLITLVMAFGLSFMRFVRPEYRITASRPPDPLTVGVTLVGISLLVAALWRVLHERSPRRVLTGLILLILGLFIVLKTELLAVELSEMLRTQAGQETALASKIDLTWLGFSYVAFRLIHTLRDRQTGRLPSMSLREYATYVIFFPSYIAGPIDRAERFVKDFRSLPEMTGLDSERITYGAARILMGLFKKFILADSLALGLALNATNVEQANSAWGLWLLLYGYSFRLLLDFSGYTDIAIGIGVLFGITLPENFNYPYLKTNIASFWQSWHITLSNWARFYVFSPLSRTLLTRQSRPSPVMVVLSGQLATMVVIGLWHGVTWNFLIWGVWHGVGLFIHKQWSDRTRRWYLSLKDKPGQRRAWTVAGWFITFHFVVVGWVWFALPDIAQALQVFVGLFGI